MNVDLPSIRKREKVLHASNTNIPSDSRILKELDVLRGVAGASVMAFGISDGSGHDVRAIDGIEYIEQALLSRKLAFLPRAIRYLFEMCEFTVRALFCARRIRPTVVHCHDTFALPFGFFAKILFRARLVYDAHELESDKNGQNAILSSVTLWIERRCWKRVDLFISVSDAIIDWYMKELGTKTSVLVLNSPETPTESAPGASPAYPSGYFNDKFGIPMSSKIFVYLGILGPGRGIDVISSAFSDSGVDAHVVFVGFGPLASAVRSLASSNHRIHFHDPVPHDQVVALVRNADFGLCLIENVSLSDYYCLPNKLFEYVFAGLPVLASKFPEIERIVREYSLGECCEPDSASVARALLDLVGQEPAKFSSSLAELSWDAQADRLCEAYEELLQGQVG